jgi:hypothetical protein
MQYSFAQLITFNLIYHVIWHINEFMNNDTLWCAHITVNYSKYYYPPCRIILFVNLTLICLFRFLCHASVFQIAVIENSNHTSTSETSQLFRRSKNQNIPVRPISRRKYMYNCFLLLFLLLLTPPNSAAAAAAFLNLPARPCCVHCIRLQSDRHGSHHTDRFSAAKKESRNHLTGHAIICVSHEALSTKNTAS